MDGSFLECKDRIQYRVKGKAIPLQAWTDPEISRRVRLPNFKINGTGRE
jgi:hypothetical protein